LSPVLQPEPRTDSARIKTNILFTLKIFIIIL
jgi:hypothetical protein